MTQETAKERIYREALENVSRSLPVNSELDLAIGEALIKAKYLPDDTDKLSVEKLQERCDRYEKALEDIRTNTPIQELLNLPYGCACHEIASDVLAAIGGDDE